MKPMGLKGAGVAFGVGLLAATMSHAQTAPISLASSDFMGQGANAAAVAPGRTLEWDPHKGRWGLKLGVDERVDRETDLRDLAPGVFYRLSPRLHIGGDVTLAPDTILSPNQHFATPQAPNPRVRLETTFKF